MPGVELWWLGQSGLSLTDLEHGTTVVFDPFLSPHPERSWPAPLTADGLARTDVVLVSHEHIDHYDRPALQSAAAAPDARFSLVVPRPLLETAQADLDLPADRLIGIQPDEPLWLKGVRIWPVPARHGRDVSDAYTFGRELSRGQTRYLGYVVELGGLRLYHAGDCIPYVGQAELLRRLAPTVVCLPINGRDFYRETERNMVGNMDPREAARLAHDVEAELLVPLHWELFAANRGFPGQLVAYVAETYPDLSVLIPGRGARHAIWPARPSSARRVRPTI
jgi:L-ascorbate 6-phosphate lactonase